MNAIVVYDSQYGNTERIARAIADTLRTFGQVHVVHGDPNQPFDLQDVDLLVVGSPTQGWKPTRSLQSLLSVVSAGQLRGLGVACFDTRLQQPRWLTGSAANWIAKKFQKMGAVLVVPPESFFVKGKEGPLLSDEVERASVWAETLVKIEEAAHALVER